MCFCIVLQRSLTSQSEVWQQNPLISQGQTQSPKHLHTHTDTPTHTPSVRRQTEASFCRPGHHCKVVLIFINVCICLYWLHLSLHSSSVTVCCVRPTLQLLLTLVFGQKLDQLWHFLMSLFILTRLPEVIMSTHDNKLLFRVAQQSHTATLKEMLRFAWQQI